MRASRSSGPGGQHANVTASRVEASFDVLASAALNEAQRERLLARAGPRVVAIAQDERSQARNRELAAKSRVTRGIQLLIARRGLANLAAHGLARRPALLDTLMGVIGDFVPPRELLGQAFRRRD